jgi:endonuclease/exonuclease/phosphatase family metal-dependent hydrolase
VRAVRRWRTAIIVALVAAVALGACSGDDDTAGPIRTSQSYTITAAPAPDFTLVSLNVLHGATCTDGNQCDVENRMALVAQHIEDAGCPDVVALQEVASWVYDLMVEHRRTLCDGDYDIVFPALDGESVGVEMVMTKLPARDAARFVLAGDFRRALRVRLDTDLGTVDLVVAHAGTGADEDGNGGTECSGAASCPPPCAPTGPMFDCQITQLVDIADGDGAETRAATVLVGDLNLVATARPMQVLFERGFLDSYLEAGNPECDPTRGAGCTSGKVDTDLAVLRDPNSRETVRVDYALVRPGDCAPQFDGPGDDDGDGITTGLFASAPATDAPGGLAWASDHAGVALDLSCR